jgi:hypothetical protein
MLDGDSVYNVLFFEGLDLQSSLQKALCVAVFRDFSIEISMKDRNSETIDVDILG